MKTYDLSCLSNIGVMAAERIGKVLGQLLQLLRLRLPLCRICHDL